MKIDNNLMVSLSYELRESGFEGKVIENIETGNPLKFIYGTGKLLPSFESNIQNLSAGDLFSFMLTSDDAYGLRREDLIINVPIHVFQKDGKTDENICRIGNEVPMMDSEGNPLNGTICEITETHVRMDFNHPMAGVDLFFAGKVLDVRQPTVEEINATAGGCSGCNSAGNSSCGCGC